MKRIFLVGLVMMLFMFGMIRFVNADTIVDTGTNESGTNWGLFNTTTFPGYQWLAGEFTLDKGYTITDVEGWLKPNVAGTATVVLYSEGGEIPNAELYSGQFNTGTLDDWYGVNGKSWFLSAGTYWTAFEVRDSETFGGAFPGSAINPLSNYARSNGSTWSGLDDLDLAIRIYGDPVPIPSAIWLLGSGVIGVVGLRRKFRKSQS